MTYVETAEDKKKKAEILKRFLQTWKRLVNGLQSCAIMMQILRRRWKQGSSLASKVKRAAAQQRKIRMLPA
jgi:hypothetical protein